MLRLCFGGASFASCKRARARAGVPGNRVGGDVIISLKRENTVEGRDLERCTISRHNTSPIDTSNTPAHVRAPQDETIPKCKLGRCKGGEG